MNSDLRREAQSEDRGADLVISVPPTGLGSADDLQVSEAASILKVRSLLLETPQGRVQSKKWSRVPFTVPDFDYVQHCAQSLADFSLD